MVGCGRVRYKSVLLFLGIRLTTMLPLQRTMRLSSIRSTSAQRAVTKTRAALQLLRPRNFSGGLKAYPSYNVFGEECMLSMKLLPPFFRYLHKSQTLVMDNQRKGRLLLEWIPKNPDGRYTNPTYRDDDQAD